MTWILAIDFLQNVLLLPVLLLEIEPLLARWHAGPGRTSGKVA